MDWYYIKNGQQVGPVDEQELFRLAHTGVILPKDRVWNASMGGEWGFAADVPGLISSEPPPVPVTPIPTGPVNDEFYQTSPYVDPGEAAPRTGPTPNADLMLRARESLQGRWWLAVGAGLIVSLLPLPLSFIPVIGTFAIYALSPPFQLGLSGFALGLARREPQLEVARVFDGFKNYWKALGLFFLMNLYIVLWTLLLIVPGIIAAYSYAMAYYILCDNPEIGVNEAITRSKAMMRGNKWKLFCLSCRFIGWMLLSILTCGIGYLFLMPYIQVSIAHFYDDIR